MQITTFAILASSAHLAIAHFGIDYPAWRADTLSGDERYSQWVYPCAGVPGNAPNRTEWPLDGGSLKLELHHPWTYVFINLGLGENVTVFNYTLTPQLLNTTGNGTLCIPQVPLPADLSPKDGDQASLQVVTSGDSGSALYNCADIVFRSSAKQLEGDECKSSNVTSEVVVAQSSSTDGDGDDDADNADNDADNADNADNADDAPAQNDTAGGGGGGGSGAAVSGVNTMVLSSVVGLALAFVYGIGL